MQLKKAYIYIYIYIIIIIYIMDRQIDRQIEFFPKKRNYENEKQYETYKNLSEQIDKNHKKVCYEDKVSKFQTDIKEKQGLL